MTFERLPSRSVVAVASAVALTGFAAGAALAATGPSSTVDPYLTASSPAVSLDSLLSVGDSAENGYQMVGIPDGLGAYQQGKNTVVLMNHELRDTQGIVRAHGQKGAFVSRWVIDPATGKVKAGSDLIRSVNYWDYSANTWSSTPVAPAGATTGHSRVFSRFCSGYLAAAGTLYDPASKTGLKDALYFANEEAGDEGRVLGVTMDGAAYQLPRLGLFSWENTVSSSVTSARTTVIGDEDGAEGQLWIYNGTKQRNGNPVQKAGLANGSLFVMDAVDENVTTDAQWRTTYGKGIAAPVTIGSDEQIDWTKNGVAQNADAKAKGLSLNRIEDGSFDPSNPNDYYFVTTEGGDKTPNPDEPTVARDGGGLWKVSFVDVTRPELGATLTLLLDGSEAPYLSKPDNVTIDDAGHLLIQEDPGGSAHLARIVVYRIADGQTATLAAFNTAQFTDPTAPSFLTIDEESSGIIPTDDLFGDGTFLLDAQVHTNKNLPLGTGPGTAEELVENGQLLKMTVNWDAVFAE